MQQPIDEINQAIASGGTTRSNPPVPVPVFVVYQTTFVDTDGTLQFRPDVYNRDAEIWSHLYPVRNPVAEREPPEQPRS
jgi:L,D-transpeptidase YcbB